MPILCPHFRFFLKKKILRKSSKLGAWESGSKILQVLSYVFSRSLCYDGSKYYNLKHTTVLSCNY